MQQDSLCDLCRTRTVAIEAPSRPLPLQRSLSAPRLLMQEAGHDDWLQRRSERSQPRTSQLAQGTVMFPEQSTSPSSLSTPQSSQLTHGSSPFSCTTRSSTPTSILEPPTTEKARRTPFTVYDAQPQNFKNPLFGTKASPSPQLAAYKGNPFAAIDRIELESPACGPNIAREHVPGQNNMATPVANLSQDINAVATHQDLPMQASSGHHGSKIS